MLPDRQVRRSKNQSPRGFVAPLGVDDRGEVAVPAKYVYLYARSSKGWLWIASPRPHMTIKNDKPHITV